MSSTKIDGPGGAKPEASAEWNHPLGRGGAATEPESEY